MYRFACLSLCLMVATCAGPEVEAPSLAIWPIEGILDEPIHGIARVPDTPDTALAAEIDRLVAQAMAGDKRFTADYRATRTTIVAALGSPAESELWVAAQLSISALDSARSETVRALGALDSILADQALSARPSETEKLLSARVASLYASQNTRYDALNSLLRIR